MLKRLIFTAGFLTMATAASAGPLLMAVADAGWSNPVGPAGLCVDIDNYPFQMQDEVRWNGEDLLTLSAQTIAQYSPEYTHQGDACGLAPAGEDPYLTAVSGYNFDPVDGILSFLPGTSESFSLGTFQHLNSPISDAITGIDYNMSIIHNDLTAPPANPLQLNLTFLHNETDNIPTVQDPNCCADIVTVVLPSVDTLFQVGGDMYRFQLLGFSPTGEAGSFGNQFTSPEGGTNTTQLWARVDPVPEPATLTLLGAGLIGLGAAARRRRKARG